MEHIMLFPTIVTMDQRKVSEEEKNIWFDLFLKHSNENGESHDWLGFEELHLEESVEFFYRDILMPAVNNYLERLQVERRNIDIHVTKSFFNITNEAGIRRHNHVENHISFVYYPHIAKGKERDLLLFKNGKHPNEPYSLFFADNVYGWDAVNSTVVHLEVQEGTLYIFPSDMDHDVEVREGDQETGIQGFHNVNDLKQSRFCVAGDMMITRNHSMSYQRTLSPPEKWKNFG